MNKINLGVIFGGMSTEHEVSVVSGTSILKNLNKEKFDLYVISKCLHKIENCHDDLLRNELLKKVEYANIWVETVNLKELDKKSINRL